MASMYFLAALTGVGRGKGRGRPKTIKMEPTNDALVLGDEEKKLQLNHEESVAREIVGSEELELLRESRRLDLEEDSTSRLMGSSSLTDDGHAEEYSLSAVGGEELMLMEDEEEEQPEGQQQLHMVDAEGVQEVAEKAKKGKKKGLSSKKRASVSSSSSASSKAQQKVSAFELMVCCKRYS